MQSRLEVMRRSLGLVSFGALALICGVADSVRLAAGDPPLRNWSFTHWAFSYDHGFIKRGLVGEVLSWFSGPSSWLQLVQGVALVSSLCAALGIAFLVWRPYFRRGEPGLLAYAVLATTHFATIQHVVYDTGRFDQFGFVLFFLCVMVTTKTNWRVAGAIIVGLATLGIVIHEAFAVIYVPLILAYWWHRGAPVRTGRWLLAAVPLVLLVVSAVVTMSGSPSVGQEAYVQQLRSDFGEWIHGGSVSVLYTDTAANLWWSLRVHASYRRLIQHLLLGVALIPSLALLARCARASLARNGQLRAVSTRWAVALIASALSPLCLYIIGVDFARWWALAITNVYSVVSLLMVDSDSWGHACARVYGEKRSLLWLALVVNLVTGPLGVAASSFPRLEPTVRKVVGMFG